MMMKNKLFLVTCFVGLIFATLIIYSSYSENLVLVANGVVNVYESVDVAMAPLPQEPIAKLMPQNRAEVIKTVDVKHYLIYKVRLSDGRVGFVNDGDYILLQEP